MKSAILAIAFAAVSAIACGQDSLDTIVSPDATPTMRGEAVKLLKNADFPTFAKQLATLIGTHPTGSGIGPRTKEPWTEEGLSLNKRIAYSLDQIWEHHTRGSTSKKNYDYIGLMLDIIEDSAIGSGRFLAITEVRISFPYGWPPDVREALVGVFSRLDAVARNERESLDVRRFLVPILFQYSDANAYLDLAIALSASAKDTLSQAEAFRFAAPPMGVQKLNPKNRKRYFDHAFSLLERIDDGKTGVGYFLAGDIGAALGIPPVRAGQCPFAPDQRLPKYEMGSGGLTQQFFQDTVNNALTWRKQHNDQ